MSKEKEIAFLCKRLKELRGKNNCTMDEWHRSWLLSTSLQSFFKSKASELLHMETV